MKRITRLLMVVAAIGASIVAAPTPVSSRVASLTDPLLFDCNFYRNTYLDLTSLSCEQLASHWTNYGVNEGRWASTFFWVQQYLQMYPDLQNVFCPSTCNYADAARHFVDYGAGEGRWGHPNYSATGYYTDIATRVLDVPGDTFAYAFHSIRVNASQGPYLAVFDTEVWGCHSVSVAPVVGDSVGAMYGTDLNFGTLVRGQSLIAARSTGPMTNPSEQPWDCTPNGVVPTSYYAKYSTANPHLLRNLSGSTWMLYWGAVLHSSKIPNEYKAFSEAETDKWRHYLMAGAVDNNLIHPVSIAPFWYFTGAHPTYWGDFMPAYGPLVDKDLTHASPVWQKTPPNNALKYLSSAYASTNKQDTTGVPLGSVTTNAEFTEQYFYYHDKVGDVWKWQRRKISSESLRTFEQPVDIYTFGAGEVGEYLNVAYHQDAGRYVVLYYCRENNGPEPDICLQTSASPDLTGLQFHPTTDSPAYGLRLKHDPKVQQLLAQNPTWDNFTINQFGVRRDPEGRLFNDGVVPEVYGNGVNVAEVVVYFPIGDSANEQSPWGRSVYAKTVYFSW